MGWSCSRIAGCRLDAISAACIASTGSQNKWTDGKGDTYFYDVGREQADGSITGTVNKFLPSGLCRVSGSFKINRDGGWERGPAWMKRVPFLYIVMHDSNRTKWFDVYRGDVTDDGLMKFMLEWVKQWLPGGINEIVKGTIPYPVDAVVTNPDTKTELLKWKQPLFFIWETDEQKNLV